MNDLKLTYGFELEGMFKVDWRIPSGDKKRDGSVHFNTSEIMLMAVNPYDLDDGFTEFESKVYTDSDKMLKDLEYFEYRKRHIWNYSCGLHLNVGSDNWQALFRLANNWQLMSKLRQQALNFCPHQKHRLEKPTQFYAWFNSRDNLMNQIHHSQKYSFCNFHPEKRLEFRFLCPCEHKVENVNKTLAILQHWFDSSGSKKYRISNRTPKTSGNINQVVKMDDFEQPQEELNYVLRSSS